MKPTRTDPAVAQRVRQMFLACPRLARDPFFLIKFTEAISRAKGLIGTLSKDGRRSWQRFMIAADSFADLRARAQFMTTDPPETLSLLEYLEVPEAVFSVFGISRRDFLGITGFATVCQLTTLSDQLEKIRALPRSLAKESPELWRTYQKMAGQLSEELRNPRFPLWERLSENQGRLQKLLAANRSPNVLFSFNHPKLLWINHVPTLERFQPRNTRYGKWVINSCDPNEPEQISARLLPLFASHDLNQMKFDLLPRGGNIYATIVYAPDRDGEVQLRVSLAAGRAPFWVPDEYCYEVEAIGGLSQSLLPLLGRGEEYTEALAERLKDREFCAQRGISAIQAEVLWRTFHYQDPQYSDHNNAYSHVIDGYFLAGGEMGEERGLKGDFTEVLRKVLPIMLAPDTLGRVRHFLDNARAQFVRKYTPEIPLRF